MTTFADWLLNAAAGDRFVYGVDDGKKERPLPAALSDARRAQEAGLIMTLQRRRGGKLEYLAHRLKGAPPKRDISTLPVMNRANARRALAAEMLARGETRKAIAAELRISLPRVHSLLRDKHEARECSYPDCRNIITRENTSTVCRDHYHSRGHCRCSFCRARG